MTITLSQINIYPIKSLGNIALQHAECTTRGLAHDRRFMVVDARHEFLTQREYPKMATVWVEMEYDLITLSAPDCQPVSFPAKPAPLPGRTVKVWASHVHAQTVTPEADEWISAYLGQQVHLVYMPDHAERRVNPAFVLNGEIVSFADGYPFLLTSEASLNDLNTRIIKQNGQPVPMNRFRPNLVVQGSEPFAEDNWKEFIIGDTHFRAVKACARCQVTTTDQATGEIRGPQPLQTLATYRNRLGDVMFGINLLPTRLGKICIGDEVKMRN